MKKISILLVCLLFVVACKESNDKVEDVKKEAVEYASYGEKISDENVVSKELAAQKFETLKEGDTINLKFASKINEVCKAKDAG